MAITQNKVLIADDDQGMCELLSRVIAPLGYESTSVNTGAQAIERIESEKFNVLMLDLMLPGPGGIEILKHIRKQQVSLEVIILTAHSSLETAVEALRLGAYDYLTKPLDINTVRSTVRQAMDKHRMATKLTAIYDLSHEITLLPSIEQVAETVLDIIEQVLGFQACGLALVDEDHNELYQLAARRIEMEKIPPLPLDGEKGIVTAAARSGELIYAPNVQEHPGYIEVRENTQSELIVPLKVKERVIGVLNIESDELDAFNSDDVKLLSTLAAQAAVVFENTHLYEEAQQEIAERKQIEEALRESEERFRDVALSTSDWVWEVDNQGQYIYCSERVENVMGYTASELLGKTPFDLMPPDEAARVGKIFEEITGNQKPIVDLENWNISKGGRQVCLLTNGVPILSQEGDLIGYRGVDKDITEQKLAEEALRKSERKFRNIVEQSSDGIVLVDEQGIIIEWNRSQEQISGIKQAEAVGQPVWDIQFQLLPEAQKTPAMHRQIETQLIEFLETGQTSQIQYQWIEQQIQRANGTCRFIELSVSPIKTARGFMVGTIAHDITERKRAEEKITQHNRELTALNEIGQTINSTLDLQETLTLITRHSIRLLDVEATSVLLHDEDRGDLWFAAASGLGAELVLGQRLAMGQGIAGRVAQCSEPAMIPDVSKEPGVFRGFDKEGIYATHSILCVPLQSKDRTIGVLEAVNKKNGDFDQEDLRLLSALAEPATTAIENARLFEQVHASRKQLRALSHRLVDVQEAERGRVARELHDETGQALAVMLLKLSLLEQKADDPTAIIARVNKLESMVDSMLENLHRLAMDLRPASLDHLGLASAMAHYLELLDQQDNLNVQFETTGLEEQRLSPETETALYRIVQEAIANVLRHAQASRVDVILERRDDQIITIIEDNGAGFDITTATTSSRLGLFGMRERAEMLGGSLKIESKSTGTTVLVEVPYAYSKEET